MNREVQPARSRARRVLDWVHDGGDVRGWTWVLCVWAALWTTSLYTVAMLAR